MVSNVFIQEFSELIRNNPNYIEIYENTTIFKQFLEHRDINMFYAYRNKYSSNLNFYFKTILMIASSYGHRDIVRLFLSAGADVNLVDDGK